jgi:hypothetical protein
MANSFAELLKNRQALAEKAKKKVESLKTSYNNEKDERFWEMSHLKNEDGQGRATIRFLPAAPGSEDAFTLYYSYFAQSPYNSKWFVHSSRKSLGEGDENDPAYQYNGKIYSDQSLSDDQKKRLAMRRQKKYIANILVVDDPTEPENNGKVFLFEYGPMIHKLIEKRMNPDPSVDDWSTGAIPFDPIEGCNFKLKIVSKKIGTNLVPNYEQSTWADVGPISEDMDKIEEIWKKCYSLKEFTDPENTKLYASVEKQKKDLAAWLGEEQKEPVKEARQEKTQESKTQSFKEDIEDEEDDEAPFDVDDKVEEKTSVLDEDDEDDFFNKFK